MARRVNLKRLRKNNKKGIGIIPRDDNPDNHALRYLSDPVLYEKQEAMKMKDIIAI